VGVENSFHGISTAKLVRKLLNVRSQKTLEFAEITALVPFSTATPVFNSYRAHTALPAPKKRAGKMLSGS
jgi:hypothetical protein